MRGTIAEPNELRPGGLTVPRLLGLLRRQAKLITATVFVFLTAALLTLLQITPIYEATALVLVDPRQQEMLEPSSQISLMPTDVGRVVSEVEILRSPSVLTEVIRKLNLTTDEEFNGASWLRDRVRRLVGSSAQRTPQEVLQNTLAELDDAVTIERPRGTYLISISVRAEDPRKAARIANTTARTYIAQQINAKIERATGMERALQTRLREASESLREAEARIDALIEESIDSAAGAIERRELSRLRQQIDDARIEQTQLQDVIEAAEVDLSSGKWSNLVSRVRSQELADLVQKREGVLAELSSEVGVPVRRIVLRDELTRLENQMSAEARDGLSALRANVAQAQETEQELRRRLRDQVTTSDLPRDVLIGVYEAQQEAEASRSVYQTLLSRLKTVDAQRDLQMPDSLVVSEALPPVEPVFPEVLKTLAGVGLGSLALGIGLAFLREHHVGGLLSEDQARDVLGVTDVIAVPAIRVASGRAGAVAAAREVLDNPMSNYSEAIRRVRLSLEFGFGLSRNAQAANAPIILVTSALPEEGKSQTALAVARSFTLAGHRTGLVDCDLRRPNVHRLVGFEPSEGLTSITTGQEAVNSLTWEQDDVKGLEILPGRRGEVHTTEMLFRSSQFHALLENAKRRFDIVVLDSSPLLPIVDAQPLISLADAVVFVVRWMRTPQQDVRRALADIKRLSKEDAQLVTLLNGLENGAGGGMYGYGYGATYAANEI